MALIEPAKKWEGHREETFTLLSVLQLLEFDLKEVVTTAYSALLSYGFPAFCGL